SEKGWGVFMRALVAVAVACVSCVGLSVAGEAQASIRKSINIPAGGLGPALQVLSTEGHVHIVFISEDVQRLRTQGASGTLTVDEVLEQLLNGTGLTYRYIDDDTISIVPVAALPTAGTARSNDASFAAQTPAASGQAFTLAQADTPVRSGVQESVQ